MIKNGLFLIEIDQFYIDNDYFYIENGQTVFKTDQFSI